LDHHLDALKNRRAAEARGGHARSTAMATPWPMPRRAWKRATLRSGRSACEH